MDLVEEAWSQTGKGKFPPGFFAAVTAFSSAQMRIDGSVMPSAVKKWIIEKPVVTPPNPRNLPFPAILVS